MMATPLASTDHEPPSDDIGLPHPRLIDTADPYEARERTQGFLNCSHRMTVLERENPFLAQVRYRAINGVGLMASSYGSAVEIGVSPPINRVSVCFVFGGQMLIDDGGHAFVAGQQRAA